MVASGDVGLAWGMVIGAGAASSVGASVVFCVRMATPKVVAASLGFAAGVMIYVCFTEILMVDSNDLFHKAGFSVKASYRLATLCFFGGVLLTALLDALVHTMMHWAARRRRQVGGRCDDPDCCSGAAAHAAFASPASSECGEEHPIVLQQHDSAAEPLPKQLCSSCAALDAAFAKQQEVSSSDGKGSEMEMGNLGGYSRGAAAALPPHLSTRRQPCCAGNPDCCGPTARCYDTGVGPAATEIAPGTDAAEVVAVLQSDPHTQDLLRMGIFTGVAIALHNIPEGLATFVGALSDAKVGASIAVAIAIHNIPEGICVAMPIYYSTGSKWKAFLWGSLTGFAEPLGGLIGYIAVHEQDPLSFAIVFGMVSGMMVYVAARELLPSAFRFDPKDGLVSISLLVGMAVMATSLLLFTL